MSERINRSRDRVFPQRRGIVAICDEISIERALFLKLRQAQAMENTTKFMKSKEERVDLGNTSQNEIHRYKVKSISARYTLYIYMYIYIHRSNGKETRED